MTSPLYLFSRFSLLFSVFLIHFSSSAQCIHPDWAIEMEAELHPNDVRTLVKVVNMLGQEVHSNEVTSGTILLYLFNDGSVEKKIH